MPVRVRLSDGLGVIAGRGPRIVCGKYTKPPDSPAHSVGAKLVFANRLLRVCFLRGVIVY